MDICNNLLLLCLCCIFLENSLQEDKHKLITILHVTDSKNTIALKAVDAAVAYHRNAKNNITLIRVQEGSTNASTILSEMCLAYMKMEGRPDVVLDTTTTGKTSELVKLVTRSLALPTISASFGDQGDLEKWRNLNAKQRAYLVQIIPPADVIPQIVRILVNIQNLRNAAVLYDSEYDLVRRYNSLLRNLPIAHNITPIRGSGQIEDLLNMGIINFFILGTLASVTEVLEEACRLDAFKEGFSWHAITQNEEEPRAFCENAMVIFVNPPRNISTIERYNSTSSPELSYGFYFELSRAAFTIAQNLKTSPETPKVTCQDYNNTDVIHASANITYLFEHKVDPTIYGPWIIKGNGKNVMPFKMLIRGIRFKNFNTTENITLGTWHASIGKVKIASKTGFMDYRSIIRFKVAAFVQPPFVFPNKSAPGTYMGLCVHLMDEISALMNFRYELYLPEGNGSLEAVLEEVADGRASVGLGSIPMVEENADFVDYTLPFYKPVGLGIMVKRWRQSASSLLLIDIFQPQVWAAIMAIFVFASILLCTFDLWSPYSYQNNKDFYADAKERKVFTLAECFKFCFCSATPGGAGELPKSLSGCFVAAAWWLFVFTIVASYIANLSAFITISKFDLPVESLDDLVGQSKIRYGPVDGSAAMDYIQEMALVEEALYKEWKYITVQAPDLSPQERAKYAVFEYPLSVKFTKLWKFINDIKLPETLEEAATWVRSSEGFALIGDKTDLDYLALTSCDFEVLEEEFRRRPYSIVVGKSSPIKGLIDRAIGQLVQNHVLEKLENAWWARNGVVRTWWAKNEGPVKCSSGGFTFGNILGVFVIIAVVLVFGGIIYFIQALQTKQLLNTKIHTAK